MSAHAAKHIQAGRVYSAQILPGLYHCSIASLLIVQLHKHTHTSASIELMLKNIHTHMPKDGSNKYDQYTRQHACLLCRTS